MHRNAAHVVDAALKRTGALSFSAKVGTMVARASQFTKHTGFVSERALTSTSHPRPHQCSNMIFSISHSPVILWTGPRFRESRPGPREKSTSIVADVHLAQTGNPPPAAGSDHHNSAKASAVAMAPVAVIAAVIAATHSTTTLSPAACGSFGRDNRGGADGGDGGNSENRLADHESLLWL